MSRLHARCDVFLMSSLMFSSVPRPAVVLAGTAVTVSSASVHVAASVGGGVGLAVLTPAGATTALGDGVGVPAAAVPLPVTADEDGPGVAAVLAEEAHEYTIMVTTSATPPSTRARRRQ